MFPDCRLLKTKIFPDKENPQTLCACVGKFLALVWNFFIVHEDNIIYLSNDTKISGFLNISGVCLEISIMCPEIRIVHKDCAIFLLWPNNFMITFPRVSGNLWPALKKFQIGQDFWSVSGNFQHVSRNFDCIKMLSNIWHNKFPDCLKFLACVRKFQASVRKFQDF